MNGRQYASSDDYSQAIDYYEGMERLAHGYLIRDDDIVVTELRNLWRLRVGAVIASADVQFRGLAAMGREEDWRFFANCIGTPTSAFYPEGRDSAVEAVEICRGCSVREECLDSALRNHEAFGVRGGLMGWERIGLGRIRDAQNPDSYSSAVSKWRRQVLAGLARSTRQREDEQGNSLDEDTAMWSAFVDAFSVDDESQSAG